MTFQIDLKGQVALVTGSSRGIGRCIALSLATAGANVIVHYFQDKNAAGNVVDMASRHGIRSQAIQADLRDKNQVQYLFFKIKDEFHHLDILVNNVGNFLMKPTAEITLEDWHEMLDTNLNATFYCCRHALDLMRPRHTGKIINIGFAGADRIQAYEEIVPYAIAKSGVLILTKSLARTEASNGITVNAISPGIIDSGPKARAKIADYQKRIPAGRVGTPQDVANAVLYLLSDSASYINGTEILVSGGWGI